MYPQTSREIREAFWKTFGRYMALVPSASGERINWINYKTGHPAIRFALTIEDDSASIQMQVSDAVVVGKLRQMRTLFDNMATAEWIWEDNGILARLNSINIRRQEDWPSAR